MARKYPKFLWSNPSNTKSSGPFIIHTLYPRFIAKPIMDDQRNLLDCMTVEIWEKDYDYASLNAAKDEIPQWFKHSGRLQSNYKEDQIILAVKNLPFLLDNKNHFTVDEARQLIRLLFPTKSRTIYKRSSSYGLKHLFERVSRYAIFNGNNKYCSNDTAIEAFELEGYRWIQEGPNRYMNLSTTEVQMALRLFKH